jgi:hypothetical protein
MNGLLLLLLKLVYCLRVCVEGSFFLSLIAKDNYHNNETLKSDGSFCSSPTSTKTSSDETSKSRRIFLSIFRRKKVIRTESSENFLADQVLSFMSDEVLPMAREIEPEFDIRHLPRCFESVTYALKSKNIADGPLMLILGFRFGIKENLSKKHAFAACLKSAYELHFECQRTGRSSIYSTGYKYQRLKHIDRVTGLFSPGLVPEDLVSLYTISSNRKAVMRSHFGLRQDLSFTTFLLRIAMLNQARLDLENVNAQPRNFISSISLAGTRQVILFTREGSSRDHRSDYCQAVVNAHHIQGLRDVRVTTGVFLFF